MDEIRFWDQITQDAKRTIYCHPDDCAKIQQAVADQGIGHIFTVRSSPVVTAGRMLVVDHQALEAGMREVVQRPFKIF
ncbi:hypothetical protein KCMC57_64580 (plasmid) [Kitasatospora sp. CMC57]|uniref:Uncharacterized protein n=2 Tax=Kitasatospora sp. CMC57 TaxID=3231513 RepID=A0AB33K7C2_9ACTN